MKKNEKLFGRGRFGAKIDQFCNRMNKIVVILITALLLSSVSSEARAGNLTEVDDFGLNPGNLSMFKYIPDNLHTSPPLVLALHGCTQSAADYGDDSGWIKFAEKWGFILLLPEQKNANNQNRCFNWFESGDIERSKGEALSVRQMVDKMRADYNIDPERIYVTGLSAGGAMTAVILAAYPDIFDGGAIIAGIPYKCATGLIDAFTCMFLGKNLNAAEWGNRVRNATNHAGPWPKVSIWHGSADTTVKPINAEELVDQWTNVHGIDQTPDVQDLVKGYPHKVYEDSTGNARVETYLITGMGHGTPVEPGLGENQWNCL
jgi:poly(hydroxyalkanoate) depolymerase family esterase